MIDKWMEELMGEPESLDELERKRILNQTLQKIETEQKTASKRGARRWKRGAVACAAILALSTVSFGASMMDGGLAEFLGGGSERSGEIIGEMGILLENQSQSVSGYTVTLNQMIHDRHGCYVLLEVSQDDDVALAGGYYYFEKTTVGIPDMTRSGWFLDQPEVHDGQCDAVEMMLHYDADEKIAGKTLRITLENFGYLDEEGEYIVLGEGVWTFEIPVEREDHTQAFRLHQEVTFKRGDADKTVTVETLYLSPMSVTMEVSDNYSSTDLRELTIQLKDGSAVEYRSGGYGTGGMGALFGSDTQIDFLFESVIDLQEIEEIWFNGTKLEI